jgi:hypothetical protein
MKGYLKKSSQFPEPISQQPATSSAHRHRNTIGETAEMATIKNEVQPFWNPSTVPRLSLGLMTQGMKYSVT